MGTTLIGPTTASANTEPPIALTVGFAILGSSLLAGLLGAILTNNRANAAARRDRYAQVVRCLVAWAEYPYRIRRRTNDDPDTLAALADRGHTLQEQLAESRAWVAAESRAVSEVLDACVKEITTLTAPACVNAWNAPPITTAQGMVLGDFGPRGIDQIVTRMQTAVTYRFGPRRLMWQRWLLRRLRRRGCLPERTAPATPTAAATSAVDSPAQC
jgi:hypothetical protein